MPRIQTVEAIVLSTRNFEEADRLLILFTKQLGKITVIAKGVRRMTSHRGGSLDLLNDVMVTLVQGQSFKLVTETQVVDSFPKLKDNLSKAFYAYYLLELVNSLTVDDQEQAEIFYLLKHALQLFSNQPNRIIITAFEIKLLAALGFLNDQMFTSLSEETIAKAKQLRVQSLSQALAQEVNNHAMMEIEELVRKRLADVAEKEFRSPAILIKLKESIKRAEDCQ